MGTFVFVLVTFVLTMGSTVTAAELASTQLFFPVGVKTLLFPVAFLIPAIGNNWIDIAKWAWRLVANRFERRSAGGQ